MLDWMDKLCKGDWLLLKNFQTRVTELRKLNILMNNIKIYIKSTIFHHARIKYEKKLFSIDYFVL